MRFTEIVAWKPLTTAKLETVILPFETWLNREHRMKPKIGSEANFWFSCDLLSSIKIGDVPSEIVVSFFIWACKMLQYYEVLSLVKTEQKLIAASISFFLQLISLVTREKKFLKFLKSICHHSLIFISEFLFK